MQTKLLAALTWWVSALKYHKPRTVPLRPVRPCVVYTDSCGEGHLGAALCRPNGVTSHGHSPSWVASDGGGIYEWELLEALLGLCLVVRYTNHTSNSIRR